VPLEIRAPRSPRLSLVPPVPTDLSMHALRGRAGADGKSAYQSAVDAGFIGTEQDWIDSLLTVDDLQDHVDDNTPHPAYDDIPSLNLLFENGLI